MRHEPGLGFGSPASDMLVVRNSQSRIAPGWGRLGIARRTVSLPYPKGPCHDPKPHAPYTTSGPGAGDCDDKSHLGFPIAAVTPYAGCVLVCKGASRPRGEAQPAWGAVVDWGILDWTRLDRTGREWGGMAKARVDEGDLWWGRVG